MGGNISPWAGRRVLVTGCTGFLGSAVTRELLDRGATVVGLIRERGRAVIYARDLAAGRFQAVQGLVEDAARLHSAMAVHEVSAVFHFVPGDHRIAAVLRAATLYHPRIPVVTARPANQLRLAEADPPPVPLGVARFGELFGGGDRNTHRVVPRAAVAMLAGEPMPRFGGPARDFVYVHDAARACLALAVAVGTEPRPHDVTFRSGWEFTEQGMAELVTAARAGRRPWEYDEPPANLLGWRPEPTLAAALGETVEWYRNHHTGRSASPARRAA